MTPEETPAACLFCRIVRGEVPAAVVHETGATLAFRDVDPQAPTHVLVIPKRHAATVAELTVEAPEDVVELVRAVAAVADLEALGDGYRTVFNTGRHAQQSVAHAHVHVIGGRPMTWPPG
jgi:histidine triad (HIT) family protein